MPTPISKKTIRNGLKIFFLLTLAGFIVIFYLTGTRETLHALGSFHLSYFAAAILLIGVDFVSGTGRIYIFIRKMGPFSERHAFLAAFKANLSNVFLAAVTPFQTGGGVAQIYMLNRAGVNVPGAVSVSIMNFVATLGFLSIAGLFVLRWMSRSFSDFKFQFILTFSSIIFYIVTTVFLIFLFKPKIVGNLIESLLTRIGARWTHRAQALERQREKVHKFVESYQSHVTYFWRHEKSVLFHNIWMTAVLYFNKCLIAYVVMRGMGLSPDFLQVVSLQILLIFLIYFCPTPGASFLAETSTAALMSLVIPSHLVSVFSVLWRFFTTYFGVIIGGIILTRDIATRSDDKQDPS